MAWDIRCQLKPVDELRLKIFGKRHSSKGFFDMLSIAIQISWGTLELHSCLNGNEPNWWLRKSFVDAFPRSSVPGSSCMSPEICTCLMLRFVVVRYILSSVWVRLSLFPQLSIIRHMGLCIFSLSILLVMIEIIYTLSYYHNQIGSMNYHPLFRVR